MKKFIIVLSVLAVFFSACTHKETTYFDNGLVQSELIYKGDNLHGVSKFFYENGVLQMEIEYENGKINGESKRYFTNGQIEAIESYSNDLKNGVSKTWNEEGDLMLEMNFTNDTLNGKFLEWFIGNIPRVEAFYKKGLYHGEWKYFNMSGLQVGEGIFNEGTGVQRVWFLNGKTMREVNFKNNLKHGEEVIYSADGEVSRILKWDNGELIQE
jgi:antitoxin component YwqK of YwqJK toxin-antitoxin module